MEYEKDLESEVKVFEEEKKVEKDEGLEIEIKEVVVIFSRRGRKK